VQLDARDESDYPPIVGVAPGQIGHHGQSASLIMVTITTRPTLPRQPPEVDPNRSLTMQPALRENECLDRFVGALRRVVLAVGAQLQARQTECGLSFQMFVAGLRLMV
jgi:hypothetical protein